MRILLVLLGLLSFGAVANAEITVKEYRTAMSSGKESQVQLTRLYVAGVGEGILVANSMAERINTPLFCQPEKLALAIDNFISIIDRIIKDVTPKAPPAELDDTPIPIMLMLGMQETFPCPAK